MKQSQKTVTQPRKEGVALKQLTMDYVEHRIREPHLVHWLIIAGGVVELVGGLKHIFGT